MFIHPCTECRWFGRAIVMGGRGTYGNILSVFFACFKWMMGWVVQFWPDWPLFRPLSDNTDITPSRALAQNRWCATTVVPQDASYSHHRTHLRT